MPTSIKITCPDCKREIKVLLHMVDKLVAENGALKKQLQKRKATPDMPDFMRDLFK